MNFVSELRQRNPVLFWYGIINLAAAGVSLIMWQTSSTMVNNINAFIKPLKFFLSIAIFCFTMGWLLYYLQLPRKVRAFNIMAVIVFTFESLVITWQAANGRLSHFNNTTTLYAVLFSLMGFAITLLTAWTAYMGYLFFRKKDIPLKKSYLWGIRLGIIWFVIFAFEGGIMASALRHSVGGDDSGEGLPVLNWNRKNGDLRVAHFFGMHSLQILPLFGYYLANSSKSVIIFATVYMVLVTGTLVQALMGIPIL